jgi:hypothetical protein
VSWVSFTEPLSSTKNAAAGSPSRKNVCPDSIAFVRAAARTSLRAIESSVANTATGFANAASVTVAAFQRVIASAVRRTLVTRVLLQNKEGVGAGEAVSGRALATLL